MNSLVHQLNPAYELSQSHQLNNNQIHQLCNQLNSQHESVDFTTLHNDIISIAEHDLESTNSGSCALVTKNMKPNMLPFQFDTYSSDFVNSVNQTHPNSTSSDLSSSSGFSVLSNQLNACNQLTTSNQPLNQPLNSSNHSPLSSSSPANQLAYNYRPVDTQQSSSNVDDGLTNLSWLQNLNMCMTRLGAPTPPASPLCNLTPFSIISPQTNASQSAVLYNKQQQQTGCKSIKSIKSTRSENGTGRKQRAANTSKPNGPKSTKSTINKSKRPNKFTNGQNYNHTTSNQAELMAGSSAIICNRTTTGQTNGHHKSQEHQDYVEMNNSLNLLYNGDHPMLNSITNYTPLCNSSNLDGSMDGQSKDDDSKDYLDGDQYLNEHIDFQTNDKIKPPFSYANLICMAMQSNRNKMTLRSIYKWIIENFVYYRKAEPSWQVSFVELNY